MRDCRAPKFSVVHLRMFAKSSSAAAPTRTRHLCSAMRALFGGSGNDLVREVIQIGLQAFDIPEFFEFASLQCAHANASRRPQSFQLARILRLALLHQPQPVTQHFAGVLVAAGFDEALNELFLTLRQHNIPGWHRYPSSGFREWHNLPSSPDRLNTDLRTRADEAPGFAHSSGSPALPSTFASIRTAGRKL